MRLSDDFSSQFSFMNLVYSKCGLIKKTEEQNNETIIL